MGLAKWVPAYARQALYAVVGVLGCAQVVAQELQEVVVTAERREEKLQDVPIAVSAFTSETLINRALGDVHALANLTPSVNLEAGAPFSGDRSVLSASIRGVGQDDFAFNLNPGVGVYLDGVYLARTIGSNLSLLDVDRVEILKGPQAIAVDKTSIDRMHETLAYAHRQHHYIVSALERGEGARVEALMREHTNPVKENLNIPGIAAQLREAKPRLSVVR